MKNFVRALLAFTAVAAATPASAQAWSDERTRLATPRALAPFAPEVYAARRAALMKSLGPGLAIVQSAGEVIENDQDPDFAYLTGITDEANAILVLAPTEPAGHRELLFLAPRTPEADVWNGERLPLGDEIRKRTGIDRVHRASAFNGVIANLATQHKKLHYLGAIVGPGAPIPPTLQLLKDISARVPGASVENQSALVPHMRSVKEPRELDKMSKAIAATSAGLKQAMASARPGMSERALQETIEDAFLEAGAQGLAFASIVASGPNSAILHYVRNDRIIADGDLVLCDVGAEFDHYASDVTRTFPASGRFSARQREVYEIVLEAQAAAAAALKPGARLREDVQAAAEAVLRKHGLIDYFPHGVGHFVGLEVHDAGVRYQGIPEGAVITIEPGVYLPDEGFGVRLEDEYLVTRNGARRLTTDLPHTADEVEAFMAAR
jgi:Xaa-Pro aminopeptidase